MTYYERLKEAIDMGLLGKSEGLPTGLDRLDDYISIKRRTMITVAGNTGAGKSQFINQAFITSPFEYCVKNKIKFKVIMFSMERSSIFTLAKWMAAKIFKDTGEIIDLSILLGWKKGAKLTDEQLAMTVNTNKYFNYVEKYIDIYEGQKTSDQIEAIVDKYAMANGYIEDGIYYPNVEDEFVIVVLDHLGLISKGGNKSKKDAIDKTVEYLQKMRDLYGYANVNVMQINRDLSKNKAVVFEPMIDHLKETGAPAEASDLVITIFDPLRFATSDANYGDIEKFKSPYTGHKFFRNISILKNTYGVDGVSVGLVFMGQLGIFKCLPKASEVSKWGISELEDIFNYNYFR